MNQRNRIIIAVVVILALVGLILGVDAIRRQQASEKIPAGSIPIYLDGDFVASFVPENLDEIEMVSFVDAEEGKTQEGWLLVDAIQLYVKDGLSPETEITVSSSSRDKYKTLTWAEIENPDNIVMFDLANKGTLKLVSDMPGFDIRDVWVQDVDKIEIISP